jgi:hypothetical protein
MQSYPYSTLHSHLCCLDRLCAEVYSYLLVAKMHVPVVASEPFSLSPARLQPSSEHSIYLQENATDNICVDYQNLPRTFSWTFATFYDGMTAD